MSQNVSGFGAVVTLVASETFPAGIVISQFANDADPIDFPAVKIGDVAMGLNGDLISWSKAAPLPIVLNVIPGSNDDVNLSILYSNNRVGQGKISTQDVLTLSVVYPDGSTVVLSQGKTTDATFGKSIAAEQRLKTRPYNASFQNIVSTEAPSPALLLTLAL